jgi:hypothetical protein
MRTVEVEWRVSGRAPREGGALFPAAVGLGTSMLIRETFARIAPSKDGTSAPSSVTSNHTTLLSPSFFLKRKWYVPGSGKF